MSKVEFSLAPDIGGRGAGKRKKDVLDEFLLAEIYHSYIRDDLLLVLFCHVCIMLCYSYAMGCYVKSS